MGLILLEYDGPHSFDTGRYRTICRDAQANGDRIGFCSRSDWPLPDMDSALSNAHPRPISFPVAEDDLRELLTSGDKAIAFLPSGTGWTYPEFTRVCSEDNRLLPWAIATAPANISSQISEQPVKGWIASSALALAMLRSAKTIDSLKLSAMVDRIRAERIPVHWLSAKIRFDGDQPEPDAGQDPAITSESRVLALVPHFQCEEWLEQCLMSLAHQTRPLDAIVVMDDASDDPPVEICSAFPNVTLVQSPDTVGPYRLVQSVVGQAPFDAYLFQDADDWTACDRLELLLAAAEHHGADLIGCQQARLFHDRKNFFTMTFPLDVNWGLANAPSHGLAHPTSLVSRRLLTKIAGFSSGMGFGADSEFLNRAVFAGRVVNTPYLSYFWRGRPMSLTNSPETGHASEIRQKMKQTLYRYYWSAQRDHQTGKEVSLPPLCPSEPIALKHLCGPELPQD